MSEIRTYYIKAFASANGYTGDDLASHLENGPLYTDEAGLAVDVTYEIAALSAALAAAERDAATWQEQAVRVGAELVRAERERDEFRSAFHKAKEGEAAERRAAIGVFDRALAAEAERDRLREELTRSHFANTLLETERDRLRDDYERACALVASMHAAAVGEVRGPDVGPVEDVAALRSALAAAERERGEARADMLRREAAAVEVARTHFEALAAEIGEENARKRFGGIVSMKLGTIAALKEALSSAESERDRLRERLAALSHLGTGAMRRAMPDSDEGHE